MLPLSIFTMFWELLVGAFVVAWLLFLVAMIFWVLFKPLELLNTFFEK
jgi:hypothetical protein